MAPNPIACANRISIPYTVTGILHVCRLFVLAEAVGSSWELVHGGNPDQPWQDDVERFLELMVAMYHTDVNFGQPVLEQYAFGAYFPLEFYTPVADVGTNSQASNLAGQLTWTFRDDVLRKAKVLMMESILPADEHATSPGAVGGANGAWLSDVLNPIGSNDIGWWLRSRSEEFISSFVAMTTTDNDKLRRARGFV